MEFGLTWAKLDEMEYVTEAEKLGFTHLWVTDSGLIRSDAFVFLTVAAQQTRTMKLGMGVAVPGLRLAPTLAAGMATLNMIAPGRCFVAMGTGNTAMRLLGRKPMTLKSFEAYARTVRNLLECKEAQYEHRGEKHTIRFMLTEKGYRNLRDPIPIWKDYLEFHMSRPAAERQKMMHESHNAYVAPDERRFVTPEVIKRFCIVGQPAEVLEQVRELERKGVRQLMCNFPLERGYQMVRDYAKNIIQKL